MVVPGARKYNPAVPFLLMAPLSSGWGMFHGRICIFLIKSLSYWSVNMLMANNKLLESGFIAKQDFALVIESPVKMITGKLQPLPFH